MADAISPLYRGDTRTFKVTITDQATGLPVDISGHSLFFTLKTDSADLDDDAVLQVSALMPSNAESVAGVGYLTVASTDSDGVTPGRYYYDIQWVQPGSPPIVTTIQAGRVRVLADITLSVS